MSKKRIYAILLALCLLFTVLPLSQVYAEQEEESTMPVYDAATATAYAKEHAFDGVGQCAQFVSTCLSRGGIEVPGDYNYYGYYEPRYWGSSLGLFTNPYICSSSLLKWLAENYPVITDPAHSDMELGDVILMSASGNPDGHAGIITGFDGDMPLYTAHNGDCLDDPVEDLANFLVKMNGLKVEGTCTGEHIKGDYLWYSEDHPHYQYYKCALCGEAYTDGATKTLPDCAVCTTIPTMPTLRVNGEEFFYGKNAELSWSTVDCATTYRLRIFRYGTLVLDKNMWLSTSYSYYCEEAGNYEAMVTAVNRIGMETSESVFFEIHNYIGTVTKPTCTQEGYTTYRCICGDSYIPSYAPPLGHNWDDGEVFKQPTQLLSGEKRCRCTRCSATAVLTVPPLGLEGNAKNQTDGAFTNMPIPAAWCMEVLNTLIINVRLPNIGG